MDMLISCPSCGQRHIGRPMKRADVARFMEAVRICTLLAEERERQQQITWAIQSMVLRVSSNPAPVAQQLVEALLK